MQRRVEQRTGVRSCKKKKMRFSNRIIRGGGCSDKNSKQIHAWGRIIRAQTLGRVIIAKSDNTIQRWGNLKVPTFRIWLAFTSYVIVRRTSGIPARTDPQNEGEDPQSRIKQCYGTRDFRQCGGDDGIAIPNIVHCLNLEYESVPGVTTN